MASFTSWSEVYCSMGLLFRHETSTVCMAMSEGRKRANLLSRLATGATSPIAGPESGGMAGCGGRQSRSSPAVPRVSGCRSTTDTQAPTSREGRDAVARC